MRVRRLTEADAEAFRALRLRAVREHPEAFAVSYDETIAEPLERITRSLRPEGQTTGDFVLGAFDGDDDGSLIGMVGLHRETLAKMRHKAIIWGMYVAREAQGQGIGRLLMERAIAEARMEPGLEQLLLAVVTTNTGAQRLYEALGFQVYGNEPESFKLDGAYFDENLMRLKL